MGKLGKETKNLLLAITVICLISFLLAAGLSFLLAKDFQHEMLLHDYGVSGYQLNHEDKLQISAFTAHPNESDIERGKEALASIGYSEATSMQLLPTVREYRNQTMLYLFLLLLFLFGMVYLVLLFYLRRQHRAIDDVLIQAQQQRGLYYAFATLVYGFLSIIVAITIFHIMNTISMGVSARTRQYGVMRAIGMSNQQLTRMISAEAASYAISGVILGCIFGLLFHWFLYSSLITRTFGNPWSVPWLELCLIIGVILATTALAVRGPARRLHAMSILELMK